jgi:ribosome maturation factor RimP
MIERMDSKPIIVEDCEKVSRTLSFILEVEDIISDRYSLEVSSAGIDRPLTRIKDFKESVGLLTKFTFAAPVNNVSKNVKATIVSADDEEVVISYEEYQAAVKYDNITKAKLVLTDELIENAKNAQECETNNIEDKNV